MKEKILIVIHKTKLEDAIETSNYLCRTINEIFPNIDMRISHAGRLIRVNNRVYIDILCGTNPDKIRGICPDYYYTDDSDEVATELAYGALKHNGKRLDTLEQVVQIITYHITSHYLKGIHI